MVRILLLLICLGLSTLGQAQVMDGQITDVENGEPLIAVNISIDGTTLGTTTNENGEFKIGIPFYPATLTISYLGYKQRKIAIPVYSIRTLNLQLTRVTKDLDEIVVSAKPKVEVIYKEPYSVVDYTFYDTYMLLLIYKGFKKKYHLVLMDEEGKTLDDISLKGKSPDKFFKSCLGGLHLMFGFYVRQLYVADQKIYFQEKTERSKFEYLLNNCELAALDKVFFSEYMVMNQMLEYFYISRKDNKRVKVKTPFTKITNLKKIRMAYDEGRFQKMADNIAAILGRPRSVAEVQSDKSFLSRVIYAPIYAPIFRYRDSICVFNHVDNQLEIFLPDGTVTRRTPIKYKQTKRWKKQIFQDESTELFYTLYKTNWGFDVRKINPLNGETNTIFEIKYLFADNFKVKDGHLYFLFNNPRINQPKYKLHKVRIE